jgi:hypothetical protein
MAERELHDHGAKQRDADHVLAQPSPFELIALDQGQ